MKLKEVELEGAGIRMPAPESASMEAKMLASRPRKLFRDIDGDTLTLNTETQLVTIRTEVGVVRMVHVSRCSMTPFDVESVPSDSPPKRQRKPRAQASDPAPSEPS